eukprot:TRINITY_DN28884_c0_g1_i1.p1 TRINITY_DN28884_c0_g1~~TRINITY_DN28884_c0_g1_i1.p1  ORF type:complete len:301 (-),score=53.66 TRINITY_DN28884_c0_g1_i1:17-919(-)
MQTSDDVLSFTPLPSDRFKSWNHADTRILLQKWGLRNVRPFAFAFNRPFSASTAIEFLDALFHDETVRSELMIPDSRGTEAPWKDRVPADRHVDAEDFVRLSCTVLSMSFFDRLSQRAPPPDVAARARTPSDPWLDADADDDADEEEGPLVHENARRTSVRRMDVVLKHGAVVGDAVRDLFVRGSGSPFRRWYSPPERLEVLFRLATMLVAGGGACQYDDDFRVYADTVKALYKDVVRVTRSPDGAIAPATLGFAVRSIGGRSLFPSSASALSPHNQFLVLVHPDVRHVILLYTAFVSPF